MINLSFLFLPSICWSLSLRSSPFSSPSSQDPFPGFDDLILDSLISNSHSSSPLLTLPNQNMNSPTEELRFGGSESSTSEGRLDGNGNGKALNPIDPTTLAFIRRAVDLPRAAYCISKLIPWQCATCNPAVHTTHITLIGEFDKTPFAFTGYCQPLDSIVVVFRGTRTLNGWIRDLRFAMPSAPFPSAPPDAKVHLGFLEAWQFLKPQVEESFLVLALKYPGRKVLIAGHSLGGAVSTLATIGLYTTYVNLLPSLGAWQVLTIGQPRVGNEVFHSWMKRVFPYPFWRVVNENDVVPHLPPNFVGFTHTGLETWIHEGETFECTPVLEPSDPDGEDPPSEEEGESLECANSYKFGFSVGAHVEIWEGKSIGIKSCISNDGIVEGDWTDKKN